MKHLVSAGASLVIALTPVGALCQVPRVAPQILGEEHQVCSQAFLRNSRSAAPVRYESFWFVFKRRQISVAYAKKPPIAGNWERVQALNCYYGWVNDVWVQSR